MKYSTISKNNLGGYTLMKEILYIVVPCYNEEEVLEETSKRLLDKVNSLVENK